MTLKPKALITGVQGFTGRYMAAELQRAGYEVFGVVHRESADAIDGINSCIVCNLLDRLAVENAVATVQPDVVLHLAAVAFVASRDVEILYQTNLLGTRNLLDALSKSARQPTAVLLASSANVYGNSSLESLDETVPPAPANDYAVSKLAMEYMARIYADKLPLSIVRPFNYTGVGQAPSFLIPKIVDNVRRQQSILELGNLDVARDFSDVRVLVQYYRRILETPALIGQTVNVCSGLAFTLNEVVEMVRQISGHDFEVRISPDFVRENEVKILKGNCDKLIGSVGKVQDIPLIDTLKWMIRH